MGILSSEALTPYWRKPRILQDTRPTSCRSGGMEDAADSKSAGSNTVGVRIPPPAPSKPSPTLTSVPFPGWSC